MLIFVIPTATASANSSKHTTAVLLLLAIVLRLLMCEKKRQRKSSCVHMPKKSMKSTEDLNRRRKKRRSRARFIHDLYTLVQEEHKSDRDIVKWVDGGSAIVIQNPSEFQKKILPKYCSHSTISSFERQMNFYRFQRMGVGDSTASNKRLPRGSAIKYRHPRFHQNASQEVLSSIKRSTNPCKYENQSLNSLIAK